MKKVLGLVLALVMALSLCTSAWATGETGTGESTTPAGTETGGTGGGETGGESGSEGTSGESGTTYVAETGSKQYETLQAAVDAASSGATVKLLANAKENVTVSKNAIVFDLNGYTLSGGTENAKPALTVNNKKVTLQDSSEAQTGTIKREDTAETKTSHYVIDIQGKNGFMLVEGGNVENNSGIPGVKGSSLVRLGDDNVNAYPTLTITGGKFTQNNFIAIKVDRGTLHFKGGEVTSANSYAIENWNNAFIKGGTINGTVSSWVYSTGAAFSKLEISNGIINGNVASVNYDSAADKQARIFVTGGTVNGALGTYTYSNGLVSIEKTAMATIEVTGGTFNNDPTKYVVENSAITKNSDGTFGVAKAYLAQIGGTKYYTMDEAFHAVKAGETITLLRDYTTNKVQNSGSKSFTIDLGGFTWTYTGTDVDCAAFEINYSDVTLTVTNGKVVSGSMVGLIPSAMGGTIKYDNAGLVFDGVKMTANGHSGIETNGNNTNDSITLKNSTLNVPNGFGIYFPSSGTLTIENSTINAKTMGVQVCAGSLEITGESAINVTGDPVPKTENDGAIEDGAAISVVDRDGYKDFGTITISGGTFTAKAGNLALKAYKLSGGSKSEFDNSSDTITVSGGTFSSNVRDYVVDGKNLRVDSATSYTVVPNGGITSGTYTEEPSVAPGYKAVKNTDGTWRVEKTGGYYYYPSTPSISAVLNGSNKSATDYTSGDYGLVFRGTAPYSSFTGVQVDGKTIGKGNYTVEQNGSGVEVYLKAAYLKTLTAGKHTVTILSTSGNASMDFTIGGKTDSPKTFDAGVGIYAVTAVLSVTGMVWVGRKREN